MRENILKITSISSSGTGRMIKSYRGKVSQYTQKALEKKLTAGDLRDIPYKEQKNILIQSGYIVKSYPDNTPFVVFKHSVFRNCLLLVQNHGVVGLDGKYSFNDIRPYIAQFSDAEVVVGFTVREEQKYFFYEINQGKNGTHSIKKIENFEGEDGCFPSKESLMKAIDFHIRSSAQSMQ